jgi:hypothetical protein
MVLLSVVISNVKELCNLGSNHVQLTYQGRLGKVKQTTKKRKNAESINELEICKLVEHQEALVLVGSPHKDAHARAKLPVG